MSKKILDYLEDLIPDREIAQMVVENADFQIARIDFNAAPRKMWYRIITEVKRYKNGMLRILKSALDEYPEDEFLLNEINKLSANSPIISTVENDTIESNKVFDKSAMKELVSEDKVQKVLDTLKQHNNLLDSDQQNELIVLTSRHNILVNESRKGIKSAPEKNQEKNTLIMSLLQFIDSI